jgi:DNA-binding protein HU-beta
MNKKELIEALSVNCRMTKKSARRFLEGFMDTLSDTLNNGENIQLVGFGTFLVQEKGERMAMNPKTQKPVQLAPRKAIKFKPGKDLVRSVNQKKKTEFATDRWILFND